MNGILSPVGVLKALFPLCFAPPRVSQHIVILTTELPHRFFTRFLSGAIVSESFFFPESGVISDVMQTPVIPSLSTVHNKYLSHLIFQSFISLYYFNVFLLLFLCCTEHDFYYFVSTKQVPGKPVINFETDLCIWQPEPALSQETGSRLAPTLYWSRTKNHFRHSQRGMTIVTNKRLDLLNYTLIFKNVINAY